MSKIPLSEQLRPEELSEIAGQEHLVGKEGFITRLIQGGRPLSLLLWGPPGCGKTTLAKLYAKGFQARFLCFSAVYHGITDLKKVIQETLSHGLLYRQTIVFVDEIHRFNKSQQDLFLPFLEDGTLVLIGATTENPSFTINNALLSRLRVLTLKPLSEEALFKILTRFEEKGHKLSLTEEEKKKLVHSAQGDGRHLLNMLENMLQGAPNTEKRSALYDRAGEGHYNLISALHKSIRGSDPDASLYWLARMLEGGEDPNFIARRLVRAAIEDIGLADPNAFQLALSAWQVYERLGSPEGDLALAEATVYLALSPKSNALYTAFGKAKESAAASSHLSPPKTILNAPTPLMEELDYGKGYQYDHDTPHHFSGQHYFPEEMERKTFYDPPSIAFEREMKKRINYFSNLRIKLN